jgi:YHS domain-containing protein
MLFTGAALVLSVAALAGPPKDKKDATPAEIKCSVMTGRTVNVKEATAKKMFADYKGNRYFFCCGGCPSQFKADPAKYAANAHIPTPKAGKADKKG